MENERLDEMRAALVRVQNQRPVTNEAKANPVVALLQAVPVAFLFLAMMAVMLFYYPDLDYALYRVNPEIQSLSWLTVYHRLGFGWIHVPSLGLGLWFCFVVWLVPRLASALDRGMMLLILRARIEHAVVEDEDEEGDDLPPLNEVPRA